MSTTPGVTEMTPSTWIIMNTYKQWGYSIDALGSTHPVLKNAIHSDSANDMINGITYGKGCGFVKQLHKVMGNQDFQQAIHLYFTRFAWQNTQLDDFLQALSDSYSPETIDKVQDINSWARHFLSTQGVNLVTVETHDGEIAIHQHLGDQSENLHAQEFEILVLHEDMSSSILEVSTSETS